MQYTIIASAALAALPFAAAGKANIFNECDFDVTAWSVTSVPQSVGDPIRIKAGSSYSEEYKQVTSGGVSLKIVNNTETASPPQAHLMQFEYTDASGMIWYDMSNVDCHGDACPFARHGWYMDASDSSCPTRHCMPDEPVCTGAYLKFNDDHNTVACANSKDSSISVYLCATEKPSDDGEATGQSYEQNQNQVQSQDVAAPQQAAPQESAPQESAPQESAPQQSTPAPAPAAQEPAPVAAPQAPADPQVFKSLVGSLLTSDMFNKRSEQAPAQRRHVHHARHIRARPMM